VDALFKAGAKREADRLEGDGLQVHTSAFPIQRSGNVKDVLIALDGERCYALLGEHLVDDVKAELHIVKQCPVPIPDNGCVTAHGNCPELCGPTPRAQHYTHLEGRA
jgi:hypothetical protein